MGIWQKIKNLFNINNEIEKMIEKADGENAAYLKMSFNELSVLSDDDLFTAVLGRTEHKIDSFDDWEDGLNSLNKSQKILYSVNWLDTEVNNGGLCQFFVNSSRIVAPYISEYLEIIGADKHKNLYDSFIIKNGIDLADLSFFDIDDFKKYKKKRESYPFDEFDNAFYDLKPLETYLTVFIRSHLTDF